MRRTSLWAYVVIAGAFMLTGALLVLFPFEQMDFLLQFLAAYLALTACSKFWDQWRLKASILKGEKESFPYLLALGYLLLGLVIYWQRSFLVVWVVKLIGVYQLGLALLNLFAYDLMRKDQVPSRWGRLTYAVFHLVFGIGSILSPFQGYRALQWLGIYLLLIGRSYLKDGRNLWVLPQTSTSRWTWRVPLPVVFSLFFPQKVLAQTEAVVQGRIGLASSDLNPGRDADASMPVEDLALSKNKNLLVQIHVGRDRYSRVGHMNVAYDGIVYSYGNHDAASRRMMDCLGDGVVVLLDHQEYLNYYLSHRITIIEYEIALNEVQRLALEAHFARMQDQFVPWYPQSTQQLKGFAGNIIRQTQGKFYKFAAGKYQTYFLFWTNCVLFSEELLRVCGFDVFPLVGIQTPGTYYDYLERQRRQNPSRIVARRVYNRDLRNYLAKSKVQKL